MRLNEQGYKLIQEFEGLRLSAYRCSAGVPTIGYGNTRYEDGKLVKMGDRITKERAESLFRLLAEVNECYVFEDGNGFLPDAKTHADSYQIVSGLKYKIIKRK